MENNTKVSQNNESRMNLLFLNHSHIRQAEAMSLSPDGTGLLSCSREGAEQWEIVYDEMGAPKDSALIWHVEWASKQSAVLACDCEKSRVLTVLQADGDRCENALLTLRQANTGEILLTAVVPKLADFGAAEMNCTLAAVCPLANDTLIGAVCQHDLPHKTRRVFTPQCEENGGPESPKHATLILAKWDRDGDRVNVFGIPVASRVLARFRPDGKKLAVAEVTDDDSVTLTLYDCSDIGIHRSIDFGKDIQDPKLWFSANGKWLIFREHKRYWLIDAEFGEIIRSDCADTRDFNGVTPDGDYLCGASGAFLEIASGKPVGRKLENVSAIAFREDGKYAFAAITAGANTPEKREERSGLLSVTMPEKPIRKWQYKGVNGDENYIVSCEDCEQGKRCRTCVHNPKLPAEYADKSEDRFFPLLSCAYCSDGSCGYRWTNPC